MSSLFSQGLGVPNLSFPSPADIELNSNYEWVGYQIDVASLAEDRVDSAIIDTLLAYLRANARVAQKKYFEALDQIGNRPVTQQDIENLKKSGLLNDQQVQALKAQIPNGANIKQIIFFGFLNEVLGKSSSEGSLRSRLQKAHDDRVKQTGHPLPALALRRLVLGYVDRDARGLNLKRSMFGQELQNFTSKLKQILDSPTKL